MGWTWWGVCGVAGSNIGEDAWNPDGREDTDNRHHHHQFNKSKSALFTQRYRSHPWSPGHLRLASTETQSIGTRVNVRLTLWIMGSRQFKRSARHRRPNQ